MTDNAFNIQHLPSTGSHMPMNSASTDK